MFGTETGERVLRVDRAWQTAKQAAGVADLKFHDLRREFASKLLESGASEHDVRDFLGHANITTTSRYLASGQLRLERALERLEDGRSRTTVAHERAHSIAA